MNDITLLHIREIPFKLDLQFNKLTDEMKKRIQVAFLFVLQYQEGNAASALHSVVKFILDERTILEGGVTLIFQSKEWDNMSHVEDEVKKNFVCKKANIFFLSFYGRCSILSDPEHKSGRNVSSNDRS